MVWIGLATRSSLKIWCAGSHPRIEDFLEGIEGPLRPPLLRELVALEIAYRRREVQSPDCAEGASVWRPAMEGSVTRLVGRRRKRSPPC